MKLIDRHVLISFFIPLILSVCFLVFMIHVIDIFDRIDFFTSVKAPFYKILLYFIFKTPYLIVEMLPVAVLFATVFSLAEMSRSNETLAVLSTGVSFFRLTRPLIIAGFGLFLFTLAFNDIVVPAAAANASKIMDTMRTYKRGFDNYRIQKYGKENTIYFIDQYTPKNKTITGVMILKRNTENEIESRIDASSASWDEKEKSWFFNQSIVRYFSNNSIVRSTSTVTQHIRLPETPIYFQKEDKDIADMSIREATGYIKRVEEGGFSAGKQMVEFHWKFAFPFGAVMMVLIGAPLSALSRRNVLITSFLLAFLGTAVYYFILYLGYSLGKNEVLHPLFAAWMGNIIFAGLSVWLLKNQRT